VGDPTSAFDLVRIRDFVTVLVSENLTVPVNCRVAENDFEPEKTTE
jgi:hypothetical protein